jgi:hypothetical protein
MATQPEPWNAQLIAANLFQLTEWVYNIILAAEADIHAASQEVATVYERCRMSDSRCLLPFLSFILLSQGEGGGGQGAASPGTQECPRMEVVADISH